MRSKTAMLRSRHASFGANMRTGRSGLRTALSPASPLCDDQYLDVTDVGVGWPRQEQPATFGQEMVRVVVRKVRIQIKPLSQCVGKDLSRGDSTSGIRRTIGSIGSARQE